MVKTYSTIQGDMWDMISLKVFGNERHIAELVDVNYIHREIVIFPSGITITIPTIAKAISKNVPPWRR